MANNILIVDCDSIVYAAGFACQTTIHEVRWHAGGRTFKYDSLDELKMAYVAYCKAEDIPAPKPLSLPIIKSSVYSYDISVRTEPKENCLHTVKIMMENILKSNQPTNKSLMINVLSGTENFRVYVDPEYKANRKDVAKPLYYHDIRQYLIDHWGATISKKVEADDVIGQVATKLKKDKPLETTIIVTIDKDLDQISGYHYNWKTHDLYYVDDARAKKFFFTQLITGDATDNIKGLPGFGPAKAKKILDGIDFTKPDASDEALRRIGLQYAIHPDFDDPEAELEKTWLLVEILTEPLGE